MADVDGSCQFSADSQPKSIGLVWGLAATRRPVYVHQMNWVNSHDDCSHDYSTNKHCCDYYYYFTPLNAMLNAEIWIVFDVEKGN